MINETPCARCPSCDYDLRGRSEPGPCPECGTICDDRIVVVYGRRTDSGSSDAAAALAVFALIVACMGLVWVALALAAMLVVLVVSIVVRRRRFGRRGAMHQLLAGPDGLSLREGPGAPKIIPWRRYATWYLRRGVPSLRPGWRRRGWRLRVRPRFGSYGSTIYFTFEAADDVVDRLRTLLATHVGGLRAAWPWKRSAHSA